MCKRVMYTFILIMLGLAPVNLVYGSVPDLIAWWTCDEGAGNVVGDASGNGHDGIFVNGDPTWTEGIHGNAVELVGPTLVEVPPIDMELTEATMAGWIKPNGSQPDWSSFIMTRTPGLATGFNVLGYQLAYHWNDTSTSWDYRGGDMIAADDWTFAAVTVEPDKATFYVNGVPGSVNTITHGPCTWNSNIYLGGDGNTEWVARRMNGALDDVSLFGRALTEEEIQVIMEGLSGYPKASGPNPPDGAFHIDTWITLSWRPGDFAVSHDVYLGDNFDDVNDGLGDTFRGNQASDFYIAGFPGYAYPEGLVPGTTYYWRIDEVNAPPDETVFKGDVWSFSIPPRKAYAPDPADGAESVALNAQLKWTPGLGAKLHTVYFGEDFDTVANATAGIPAGGATYNPGLLKAAKIYYWRVDEFDAVTTYKGDVWSFTTEGAVGNPNPADGAVDIKQTPTLTWTAAIPAASHEIYFGSDEETVRNATTASPEFKGTKALGDESYNPGKLAWNTSYCWRIDEVNDTNPDSPWTGRVWSFTTADFMIVDNFEDYTDDDTAGEAIWQSWIDGFGVADNGSQVGNLLPPYAEQTIVHSGLQSMPLFYDNTAGTTNSEAVLTLTDARDWTEQGVAELSLWFHGAPASVGSFVEGPTGTYTMTGSGADIWNNADEFHYAYKTLTGAGSITARVESLQNTNAWAKAGVMVRDTLDAGSRHGMMIVSAASGLSFQYRTETDGASASADTPDLAAPYWVKLERTPAGNLAASYSEDGITWRSAGASVNIPMSTAVNIGLAVTSHDAALTCEAVFSNVSTTGMVSGSWTNQDIGIASNAAEPLYVAVSNASGAPAVVPHDDINAAQIDEWTEWVIPLQAFSDQGINLINVDKIAIGLGTGSGAAGPGGTGTMYFDDIRLYRPAPEPEPQP
jgi:hypothetical protein